MSSLKTSVLLGSFCVSIFVFGLALGVAGGKYILQKPFTGEPGILRIVEGRSITGKVTGFLGPKGGTNYSSYSVVEYRCTEFPDVPLHSHPAFVSEHDHIAVGDMVKVQVFLYGTSVCDARYMNLATPLAKK